MLRKSPPTLDCDISYFDYAEATLQGVKTFIELVQLDPVF